MSTISCAVATKPYAHALPPKKSQPAEPPTSAAPNPLSGHTDGSSGSAGGPGISRPGKPAGLIGDGMSVLLAAQSESNGDGAAPATQVGALTADNGNTGFIADNNNPGIPESKVKDFPMGLVDAPAVSDPTQPQSMIGLLLDAQSESEAAASGDGATTAGHTGRGNAARPTNYLPTDSDPKVDQPVALALAAADMLGGNAMKWMDLRHILGLDTKDRG